MGRGLLLWLILNSIAYYPDHLAAGRAELIMRMRELDRAAGAPADPRAPARTANG